MSDRPAPLRMSLLLRSLSLWLAFGISGCGGSDPAAPDAPAPDAPDAPASQCLPIPATGQFVRRANPRVLPGAPFSDGDLSLGIADPDVRWDAAAGRYEAYYLAPHAAAFGAPSTPMIRRATSPDHASWTVDDAPALAASTDPGAWDRVYLASPTVIHDPSAPADRRYLMMYAGGSRAFPFGHGEPELSIGAAFSADGVWFTRVPAAASPHGQDGLVITGAQVYPGATGALLGDPELALVDGTYHLWFSSLACSGPSCETITDAGVAHATSTDGIAWTVLEAPVRSLLRASADRTSGGSRPSVIYDAPRCRYEMWLTSDAPGELDAQPVALANTRGVFHADSTDGITWFVRYDRPRDLAWSATEAGEHLGMAAGADVAANGTGRLMLYVGYDDQGVPAGFELPDRAGGVRPGVTALNVATRDLTQ